LLSAPPATVPETVRDAVLARLMGCSAGARALTELVSLLPGRTPSWLVRTLLGDVGGAADEAVARGLLRYQEETLRFRHELGRLAVEGAVPHARAQELHAAILRAMAAHDVDLSQLVHHASHAQDVPAVLRYSAPSDAAISVSRPFNTSVALRCCAQRRARLVTGRCGGCCAESTTYPIRATPA